MPRQARVVERDAEAGTLGCDQVAVAHLDHAIHEVGPAGLVLRHVLLQLPVRDAHPELHVRRDRHGPRGERVRKDSGVEGLGEGADLLHVRDAPGDADIRAHEGDAGPLCRSLESYENYYTEWGQTWERMMLIKARGVAGSATLAAEFVETIQPFRYPRSLGAGACRSVSSSRRRSFTAATSPVIALVAS